VSTSSPTAGVEDSRRWRCVFKAQWLGLRQLFRWLDPNTGANAVGQLQDVFQQVVAVFQRYCEVILNVRPAGAVLHPTTS
jgi:hypothetical protein